MTNVFFFNMCVIIKKIKTYNYYSIILSTSYAYKLQHLILITIINCDKRRYRAQIYNNKECI